MTLNKLFKGAAFATALLATVSSVAAEAQTYGGQYRNYPQRQYNDPNNRNGQMILREQMRGGNIDACRAEQQALRQLDNVERQIAMRQQQSARRMGQGVERSLRRNGDLGDALGAILGGTLENRVNSRSYDTIRYNAERQVMYYGQMCAEQMARRNGILENGSCIETESQRNNDAAERNRNCVRSREWTPRR